MPRGVDFVSANENVHFSSVLLFHPTLRQALEKRKGAGQDFRDWALELAEGWREASNLCAAHTAALTAGQNRGASIHDRILAALDKVSGTLGPLEQQGHRR